MIKFSDWIIARESSSFTRLRDAAAKGLMPPIPDASINSRSTATPAQKKSLLGKGRKKKKSRKKKKTMVKNNKIDQFIRQVEELEKEVAAAAKRAESEKQAKK